MITIEQWRACIGRFVIRIDSKSTNAELWNDMGSNYGGILLSRIIKGVILYLFSLLIVKLLLLCSGNVELNPGPSGCKTCPSCHEKTIPLKLRVCPCGYIFRKKSYRQPHASFGTVPNTTTSTIKSAILVSSTNNTCDSDCQVDSEVVQTQPVCTDDHEVGREIEVQTQPVVKSVKKWARSTNNTCDSDCQVDSEVVQTQPVCNDNHKVGREIEVQTQPVVKSVGKKWQKYKNIINIRRRHKYQVHSQPVKSHQRQMYRENPSLKREKSRAAYQLNPSPVKKHKKDIYWEDPESKREHKKDIYWKDPLPKREKSKATYQLNPSPVKKRKKDIYWKDPLPKREKSKATYHLNPSPVKKRKKDVYWEDPESKREHKKDVYWKDPLPKKEKSKVAYHLNPCPIKEHKKQLYKLNASPIKKQAREQYKAKSSPIKRHKRQVYASNPSPIKKRNRTAYHMNPTSAKLRSKRAYYSNHEGTKEVNRQKYSVLRKYFLDRHSLQRLVAYSVTKKYKVLRESVGAKFNNYVSNLTRKVSRCALASARVEAEHLVKTCLHFKDMHRKTFVNAFKKLKLSVLATLSKALDASEDGDAFDILLGPSMHTPSTESFFPESTYHDAAISKDGKVDVDNFPKCDLGGGTKVAKNWMCSPDLCKVQDKPLITKAVCDIYNSIGTCDPIEARHLIQHIDDCDQPESHDPLLSGHSKVCHLDENTCNSTLLYLRRLSPHFPNIRKLVNMIYGVKWADNQMCSLDQALQASNLDALRKTVTEQKHSNYTYGGTCSMAIDETKILEKFMNAFVLYNKKCSKLAEFPCMSCNKLCFKRECVLLERCKLPVTGNAWQSLLEYLDSHPAPDDGLSSGYICKYCIEKFRNGTVPSRCVLNGLSFEDVPSEILDLNPHERILIQRAKAFQVVYKMQTVAGKRLPPSHKISKVKGSTFHLPLPLNETLKRLPQPDEPLPPSGEFFILLRSIPTQNKIIWQDLVDVKKVYRALCKLKTINPLYAQINLPKSALDFNLADKLNECVIAHTSSDSASDVSDGEIDSAPEREPMVRKISKTEEHELYHDFTIHALHAPRENEKASHLYQLLRNNESPIDTHCKQLDILCFPDLFPHGYGGQHEAREVQLGAADYIKALLQSRCSRFRRNIQFLFFHLHQATLRQISSGVYHKLNIVRSREKLTVSRYLEMLQNDELEGDLTSVFARIRNTEQYWKRPRNELNAMSFYYGPATWYLTLSPSEWTWEDLGEYLRKINPDLTGLSVSALVAADPVSTSRFIDNKLKAFLDFITSEDNPIGKVTHYYYRREYQGRGLQHFHFLIWVENAPIIGKNSNEEIAKFITTYCTCSIPDKALSPIIHNRVINYQNHRCNSYCLRSKKTKLGIRKVCRFGFPRPARDTFNLRSVVEAIAGRKALRANSRLYDLPRQTSECMINDYNPAVMLVWEGNMDIQYIGEKSAILNWYITKYTTKAERSHANTAFTELTSTKSLASRLWNVALRSLSNRECGALEASDTLLGIPLYGTDPSTVFRWVDVNMVCSHRVKESHIIKELPGDSEDILYPSMIDNYYPNRPAELDDMNLYTFMSWYDIVSKQPSEASTYYPLLGRFLKKRNRPYLINHFKYNPKQKPEKYFYSILLLFKAWRDPEALMGDSSSYTEAFYASKESLMDGLKYHDQLLRLQEADAKVRDLICDRLTEMKAEEEVASDDLPANGPLNYVCTEVHNAMAEFDELFKPVSLKDANSMISNLNHDQLRIFNKVKSSVEAQLSGTTTEPIRMFVSGCGGTGKSFLINTIRTWVLSATDKGVAVIAPTGIAAVNINGLTIHRSLMLPVEHGKTPKYRPLSDDALKITRDALRNVTLVIIDEISMVSNVTLLYIHLRLTEIFQTEDIKDGWFGKRNMVFFGDLLQLPPVFEGPVYTPLTAELAQKYTGCIGAVDLWRNLFTCDELTINMRQKDEKEFIELLCRVCLGCITTNDIRLLNERRMPLRSDSVSARMKEIVQKLVKLPPDTVCLLPTRNMCSQLNQEMLKTLDGEEIRLIAIDTVNCPVNLKSKVGKLLLKYNDDSSSTAGLEKEVVIKINSKIMLCRNIDITLGLVNGTIGTVKSVKYCIDQPNVVESIAIQFGDDKIHHLTKVKSKFQILDKAYIIREQFPISCAYSITIHKAQGMTLRNVVVDIGNSIFTCGQSYVAMSRVTSLSGLHIINFDPRSIKALDSAIAEYTVLRQKFTPSLPSLSTNKKKPSCVVDRQWCITKSSLLAQQNSSQHASELLMMYPKKGFINKNEISYANSILQCLFCSSNVRHKLIKESSENIKQIVKMYESPNSTPLDCSIVCDQLGSPYNTPIEQNPADFLSAFVKHFPSLYPLIEHSLRTQTICPKCASTTTSEKKELIMNIPVNDLLTTSMHLNDLLCAAQEWHICETQLCPTCNVPLKVQNQIVNANHLIVFKFDVWDSNGKVRRKSAINCVPSSSVKIENHLFKPKASVHYEKRSTKPGIGYVSIISSKKKFVHCHNQMLTTVQWPRGAKDLYLLFFECTSIPCETGETSSNGIDKPVKTSSRPIKRKLSDVSRVHSSVPKKVCTNPALTTKITVAKPKPTTDCELTGFDRPLVRTEWPEYRYYPVDETWQQDTCRLLGLRFINPVRYTQGGPDVILTLPDISSLKRIGGDGNCLFRALCYIITGSETQHFELRSAIVAHMLAIPHLLCGIGSDGHGNYFYCRYDDVESYLLATNMGDNGTWGTDVEMCVLAHLVNVVVYSFNSAGYWVACLPHGIDRGIPQNFSTKSLYIYNFDRSHFDVVMNVHT